MPSLRASVLTVLSLLCLAGCGDPVDGSNPASLPTPELVRPYAYPALSEAGHAEVCGTGSGGPACEEDADCRICHDGSDCGIPVNVTQLEERGAMCQHHDAAECEYAAVRCCAGGCRVTPY
ncbi:MAG: hypothetical protein AB8I08_17350 [Sandaracinaceae bacterium]